MPLPSLYVNPEDRIDSNELAKQLAEDIKQFQAEQQNVGGGGSAGAAQAVQVEIDAPEADKVDGSESIALLDAIREATQTTANFVKGMSSQVYSMHMDALQNRGLKKTADEILDQMRMQEELEELKNADANKVSSDEPPKEDATNETSEHETGPMHQDADKEDPNDAAQENNEKAAKQDDDQGKKKQGVVGKMMSSMLGGIKNMIGSIVKGFQKFIKFFLFGLAALAGAALMVTGQGVEIFRMMREAFDNLVNMLAPVVEAAMSVFGGLLQMILATSNALMPAITAILEQLVPVVKTIVDVIMRLFNIILAAIEPILDILVNQVLPPLVQVFNSLVGFFMMLVDFLEPIVLMLGNLVGVVATNLGQFFQGFNDFLSMLGAFMDGDMAAVNRYALDMQDRLPIMIANSINGIIDFIAGLVEMVPGKRAKKAAAALRDMKVEFGDRAQARIDKRGEEDGSTAARKAKEVDFELPAAEFKAALEAKVADGSLSETVAGQLMTMKEEQDASKAALEVPAGPDSAAMIMEAISDSLANSTADTATMAEKFEVSQAELNAGRGTIVDTSDYVDTIPSTPASMVNAGSTDAKESEKDSQRQSSQNNNISAPVITNTTAVKNQTTTSFGMGSSGSDSLGHRHRRVLPGIA